MTGFELKVQQGREFRKAVLYLERNAGIPAHDAVRAVVGMCPSLNFEYLQIVFSDWASFRLETLPEIDSMLTLALKGRGVAA